MVYLEIIPVEANVIEWLMKTYNWLPYYLCSTLYSFRSDPTVKRIVCKKLKLLSTDGLVLLTGYLQYVLLQSGHLSEYWTGLSLLNFGDLVLLT